MLLDALLGKGNEWQELMLITAAPVTYHSLQVNVCRGGKQKVWAWGDKARITLLEAEWM